MFKRKPDQGKNGETSEFVRTHDDGELICREGEVSGEMYVIQSGEVRIFKNSPKGRLELAVLSKGNFFGEMSLLEGLPRDASAEAIGETQLLVMTAGALLVRLRRDPTFAFELLRRLSSRVRRLNAQVVELHSTPESEESLLFQPETARPSQPV